jgi:hypothetical protein
VRTTITKSSPAGTNEKVIGPGKFSKAEYFYIQSSLRDFSFFDFYPGLRPGLAQPDLSKSAFSLVTLASTGSLSLTAGAWEVNGPKKGSGLAVP